MVPPPDTPAASALSPACLGSDPVLDAMGQELRRSLAGLVVPGTPRPYFLQYTVRRIHDLRLRAAYGSLLQSREEARCRMYADIRVGSHAFDNNIDGGLDTAAEERESADWLEAPEDLDGQALQIALWKLTQLKFDEAVKDYYDHRKTQVTEYLRDELDAFTRERAVLHAESLESKPFPRAEWESILRRLSRRFLDHPDIHDPSISLQAERVHRWLVNSEGTRLVTEDVFIEADVSGWILTTDGVYTEASRQLYARSLGETPDEAALESAFAEVVAELEELREAWTPGSIIGPALLGGQAAATLFHEALGHRLEGERLVARGETRTFTRKVGESILPCGLSVYDDPTIEHFEGEPVWGSYRFDDQGVPSQRVELVRKGVLKDFLRSRTPAPGAAASNGHGRHDGVQPVMARMGNLVIEAEPGQSQTRAALEDELVKLARSQGRRHAVIIERVHGGETSTSSYDFQVFKGEPSEVYLLDVETGERRRIRDVELIGTPLSALQRVVAVGGPSMLDQGYCYAESGVVPVSGISPCLLLNEVELQQASTSGFHEPLLPPPFADDGQRGRRKSVRGRGRRPLSSVPR